jgi:Spy/CpxP family protein refolding chaperone
VSAAATGPVPARGRRRRRVLLALLVVSLALNLCFIGGAAWIRIHHFHHGFGHGGHLHEMAATLNLDPQQRTAFDRYVHTIRTSAELMHEQIAPLIASAWDEVAKPQPDRARITQLFDEAAQQRRQFQSAASDATIAFLATLSSEQRAQFVALAHRRQAAWEKRLKHHVAP